MKASDPIDIRMERKQKASRSMNYDSQTQNNLMQRLGDQKRKASTNVSLSAIVNRLSTIMESSYFPIRVVVDGFWRNKFTRLISKETEGVSPQDEDHGLVHMMV